MARHGKPPASPVSRIISAFFAVVLVAGLGLIAYPTVADWWNQLHQSRAVASYIKQTQNLSKADKEAMLRQARVYNQALTDKQDRWHLSSSETKEYNNTLNIGDGVMGYVTIPKIKVRLPIYHGTDDDVLQIAVGHLPGSSLPVGGETTHAVVSGHTGLPSARLLTGLDELKTGDTFAFHVLDDTYTYQVDDINVVLPDDLSHLNFENGKDYVTLITCTPYGVNTHRLLVRGHRIPNPANDDTRYATPETLIVLAVLVVLAGAAISAVVIWQRRRDAGAEALVARHAESV